MTTTLIPALGNPDLKLKLEKLLLECIEFRGCTAFWTIPTYYFYNVKEKSDSHALIKAIQKPNSFFCADIHLPTNIDNIFGYTKLGVTEIYLHKYRQGKDHTLNTNLLHSKVLLFDLDNENAEIWIGSHNFTDYAISGKNLEASVAIQCEKTDDIYKDTNAYLEKIKKDFCLIFDPTKVEFYKQLQYIKATQITENIALKDVVTLVGYKMHNLDKEQIIQLLSLSDKDYSKYKVIGDEIHLHAYDIETKKEHLYKCKIEQSGKFDDEIDKLKLDFTNPRRFAYTGITTLALLKEEKKIEKADTEVASYFVNLQIIEEMMNFEVYLKPANNEFSYWKSVNINQYNSSLGVADTFDVQEISFDLDKNGKRVSLQGDWLNVGTKLNRFYIALENLIKGENGLIGEQVHERFDVNIKTRKKALEDFIKRIKKEINLPAYFKSQMERIIIDNDPPKEENKTK